MTQKYIIKSKGGEENNSPFIVVDSCFFFFFLFFFVLIFKYTHVCYSDDMLVVCFCSLMVREVGAESVSSGAFVSRYEVKATF